MSEQHITMGTIMFIHYQKDESQNITLRKMNSRAKWEREIIANI